EQLGEISDLPGPAAGQMGPASVVQNGIAVQVKKLNLTQIATLANQFQNMGGGTKLMGLDVIQSPGQTHYYDMIAKVVNFGLPAIADSEGAPATEAKGKGRPNRPARNARPSRPADTEPE
ncbi:MAG TPA: hypothetical protein PKC28_16665, partial [Bdellovibrionales bacterium]|nr:hypothetical protein [Bdellovibrionales bacterium]